MFFILFIMSLLFSLVELIGISAIIPFISVIANPGLIQSNQYLRYIYAVFEFPSEAAFIKYFGISVITFYIIRGIYVVFYNYLVNHFSFDRKHVISSKLFKNYLDLPYVVFSKKNSSDLTKALITETHYFSLLLNQLLFFFSETMLLLLLYSLLIMVNWRITVVVSVFISVIVFFLAKTMSRKMKQQGANREFFQGKLYKVIDEALNNFKIIKLSPDKHGVLKKFDIASCGLAWEQTVHSTWFIVPRNVLEVSGFSILMCVILYLTHRHNSISSLIPVLSTFVLALYRMMPAANKVVGHYHNLLYAHKSLDIIYKELRHPVVSEGNNNIAFNKNVQFDNVSFSYENTMNVLRGVSLNIDKGSKIGIIGESGAGKSTFIDLVIGLIKPSEGVIRIDGIALTDENIKSWRQKIGYIPQNIYLFDGTVAENVSVGHAYDEQKLIKCLKNANIYEFLANGNGLETPVGENGVLLSGGQKQRIGIARALYGEPEVLIFDEGTSALDTKTEAGIVEEIFSIGMDKTLIIVAHRLSMIKNCREVYKLERGNLVPFLGEML